jgi:Methyltransferase domain
MDRGTGNVAGLVNRLLAPVGVMVTRAAPSQAESWRSRIGGPYRSDREVIRLAHRRGLSVGDFIEEEWKQSGRARTTIERMRQAGAIPPALQTVCEIGPGSGRYIQGVLEVASPSRYDIYEIEQARARWLARTYPVSTCETTGERLASTPDGSVDLVHAHGVFASLKVISCLAYFKEMARVTRPDGHVVFDIIGEDCLTPCDVDAWLATPLRYVNFLSQALVVEFFDTHGLTLVDQFLQPLMIFGRSSYLVFRKRRE